MQNIKQQNNEFVKAIITDVLKRSPDFEPKYSAGEEYSAASYKIEKNVNRGDGVVVFYNGYPVKQKLRFSYSNGRIRGLNGITIELFKKNVINLNK